MADTVVVTVGQGVLRGKKVTARYGAPYYSFQGVPYAKPPVGPLRFKAPQPPDPWDGIRDALTEGSIAPQVDLIVTCKGFAGDEDCLFLNVYTTKLPEGNEQVSKPVMFWIHGGGFYLGSSSTTFYGPDYLMTGDIVLVTINYRLGVLGFLSTGDNEVSGNNGFKDQVMALRWVQQNIAQFGGDPHNVTIFGESAGAASVHHHVMSPMSAGLFHRAVSQSGSALNPWAYCDSSVSRGKAFRLGEALGCNTTSSKELLEFLRKMPVTELLEGAERHLTEDEKHPLAIHFNPTNEEENPNGEEVFLPDSPSNIISQGKFNKVPFIIGVTSEEALFFLKDVQDNPNWFESLNENFEILLTKYLTIENTKKAKEIADKVKTFYFGEKKICKDTLQQYFDFFSDFWFIHGIHTVVQEQSTNSPAPVYFYRFAYDGKLGFADPFLGPDRLPGVAHGDDIGYLFHMYHHPALNLSPEDESMEIMAKMVKMWTNFAKTGNPTPENDPLLGVTWIPASKSNMTYLNIDKKLTMLKDIEKERIAFWEEIYSVL